MSRNYNKIYAKNLLYLEKFDLNLIKKIDN